MKIKDQDSDTRKRALNITEKYTSLLLTVFDTFVEYFIL